MSSYSCKLQTATVWSTCTQAEVTATFRALQSQLYVSMVEAAGTAPAYPCNSKSNPIYAYVTLLLYTTLNVKGKTLCVIELKSATIQPKRLLECLRLVYNPKCLNSPKQVKRLEEVIRLK